jgi:glycosyltransferase involved in cell wall biosynthesis
MVAAGSVGRTTRVHLINPLWDWNGGAERRTAETWRLLRRWGDVAVWSEYEPAPEFVASLPVRRISPLRLSMPFGDTIVFVGVYFRIGHWIRLARPQRIVILYNTDQPDRLAKNLRRIAGCGCRAEVVASSHALARRLGRRLPLLESPIELSPFVGASRPEGRAFTVGRLSRDNATKHHDDDPELYRRLAAAGCRVRIMGGTCLAGRLAGTPNIEMLPAGAENSVAFLRSIDCFLYRTNARWFEGFGRVVFEAMASGLPVVCSTQGGYADYLSNGRDCLFFDTTAEAVGHVLRLRDDASLRRRLAAAAPVTAQSVVGDALQRRTCEFLFVPSPGRVYRHPEGSARVGRLAIGG